MKKEKSYIDIVKATSIFGGVQFFNIFLQVIRSKLIAIFLGPLGMGLIGLFTSTTGLISGISGFGLSTSAIKDIASAEASENRNKILFVTSLIRKLMLITGIIGVTITIVFSPILSKLTFSNNLHITSFIYLSITLLFIQLNNSNLLLLQGFRKLKLLAKAGLLGNLFSLFFSLPLLYYFKVNGIVPSIIISSIITFYFSSHYVKKLELRKVKINIRTVYKESSNMLKMGFLINMSSLLTVGASYIVRIFVTKIGGVEQVGLYSAGFAIINTYFGLILTAMGTDYYPRLASISDNNFECKKLINQQAEIAILIIAPILLVFIIFIKPIIYLLYSMQFIAAYNMIIWASLGMFFKTVTWAMGFLLLAKSSSKIFFFSELVSNIILLIFNLLGYKYYGLDGLGISFLVSYVIASIQIFFLIKYNYDFSFEKDFIKIFIIHLFLAISSLIILLFFKGYLFYSFGIFIIIMSIIYSLKELNERIDLFMRIRLLTKVKFNNRSADE